MKNKKRRKKELKVISILQILLLVIAIVAFSWLVGESQVKVVSAAGAGDSCKACVGNSVYTGVLKNGACDITNGIKEKVCEDGQECVGGACIAIPPEDPPKKINIGNAVGTGVTVLNSVNNIKQTSENIKGAKNIFKRLFSKKAGGEASKEIVKSWFIDPETGMMIDNALEAEILKDAAANDAFLNTIKPIHEGFFSGNPSTFSGVLGQFLMNAAAAAAVAIIINSIMKKFASERNMGDIRLVTWISVAPAAAIGMIGMAKLSVLASMGIAGGVVALAFGLYMFFGYQVYSSDTYTYRVLMWQAPLGGNDCEKCNSLTIGVGDNKVSGCSEYICHTYGAACVWFNKGNEGYETCTIGNPNDKSAPIIEPVKEIYGEKVFQSNLFDYQSSATATKIIYNGEGGGTNKCVPTYTPITLAFKTNEEAYCKISLEPTTGTSKEAFERMQPMFEGTVYVKNHTVQLPSSVAASSEAFKNAGYSLDNGGNYKFYIRCSDYWENINNVDYVMEFCVQMGPDKTLPKILESNPSSGSYIKSGTVYIEDFQVYTDEPADCRWDTRKVNYEYMSYEFERCSQNIDDYIAGFDYGCRTNLTQFRNSEENKYYIACRDKPEYKGNVAKENQRNTGVPYEVILIGTNRLIIQTARINNKQNGTTIRSPDISAEIKIDVLTSNGAEGGKAKCLYSVNSNDESSYSFFSNYGDMDYLTTNTEELYMPAGAYTMNIKCMDIADNVDETMINFVIETDTYPPSIIRVFKDEGSNSLKIITNEESECVYSTVSCVYDVEDGILFETGDGLNHYVDWDSSKDLYVKCFDEYGNSPFDGVCSIIVRPFEIAQLI